MRPRLNGQGLPHPILRLSEKKIATPLALDSNLWAMASTLAVSRSHLIFGLCLPLAVLLGYLLAEPLESSSLAVVVMVLTVLCVPVLMRWHHPLLVVSWHAALSPLFFPGRPYIWVVMAFVSLGFGLLKRSVNPGNRFLSAPSVTRALLALLGVVLVTAWMSGGVGLQFYDSAGRGFVSSADGAALAGDYHNGPLSVIIPFGIWGEAAFVWFLAAGLRALHRNYQFGAPELRQINAFLLSFFVARGIFFIFVLGALRTELFYFTGLVGFRVALNGGVRPQVEQTKPALVEFASAWS
jgi:hypothetical protein